MRNYYRAAARGLVFAVLLLGLSGAPRLHAQVVAGARAENEGPTRKRDITTLGETDGLSSLIHIVRQFDFDERKLGNFEDVPAHWTRLRGDGLPSFSRGEFDESLGAAAPPSFRLNLQTGNVAYEYQNNDLVVVPHSDYRVSARVRPRDLKYSVAFVTAYFLNHFGERIPDSQRTSNLIAGGGRGASDWQRAELLIPGEFADAHQMRIQLWILQNDAWKEPNPRQIDPIAREDVNASAWFDDIVIHRLPRARLRMSTPAGVIAPGKQESLTLELSHSLTTGIQMQLDILDAAGRNVYSGRQIARSTALQQTGPKPTDGKHAAAPKGGGHAQNAETHAPSAAGSHAKVENDRSEFSIVLPALPTGDYEAVVQLFVADEPLLERRARFVTVPELPVVAASASDFGVDLGPWQGGSADGLVSLVSELGVATVKIGVPLLASNDDRAAAGELVEIANVARELAKQRIDTVAVLLPSHAARGPDAALSDLVKHDQQWRQQLSPTLVHFSGLLTSWQLGDERTEIARNGWDRAGVETVRNQLRRFISIPELIVPGSSVEPMWRGSFARSTWVPLDVPARDFVRHFLETQRECWLRLETPAAGADRASRWAEMARRLIMAKALDPRRIVIDAPFHVRMSDHSAMWEPNLDYPVIRTIVHHLSGKQPVSAMVGEDTLAILFREGSDEGCLAIWSWRDAGTQTRELYLGPSPQAVDLLGKPVELGKAGGRTSIPVGPSPIFISGLHAEQALIEASFELSPTQIQVHDPNPRPVVQFRNPYDQVLSGEIWLSPPRDWIVQPQRFPFALQPGESLQQALLFELPPQQAAVSDQMEIKLQLRQPERTEMEFVRTISVGLHEIAVEALTHWEGDTLIVEHTLRNNSDQMVRFASFCEAPGRPRTEGLFLDVAKGEVALQTYVYPKATAMRGATLHLGIEEIRGPRRLNQLVEVKP